MDPELFSQFQLLEDALAAMGVAVWPMVEFEADDALASAAEAAARDERVDRVIICTPDKDLLQCVRGTRVVQMNRRTREIRDEAGVSAKFGVPPESIPDYLALVGDAADGYPGLPGWGAKSTAAVLARFRHLESIPPDFRDWHVNVSSAGALAGTLARERDNAFLFRTLATLRTDSPLFDSIDDLQSASQAARTLLRPRDSIGLVNLPVNPPVPPMLSKRIGDLPVGGDWIFEPKWDGFRALVFRDGDEILIQSRDEKSLNRYFPELLDPLREQLPNRCVLDGEIVIARNDGLDFRSAAAPPSPGRVAGEASFPGNPGGHRILRSAVRGRPRFARRTIRKAAAGARRRCCSSAAPPIHLTPAKTARTGCGPGLVSAF